MKFYKDPFSGPRVVTCGHTDGQTAMANLTGYFLHFLANVPTSKVVPVLSKNHSHEDVRGSEVVCPGVLNIDTTSR